MAVAGILVSIGGEVVKLLVEPISNQFRYVFRRKNYIEDLRNQVEILEALRVGLQGTIDHATRNREEIQEDVKHWIEKVDGFTRRAKEFLESGTNVNGKCLNGWFPDLVTRYRLGKEAKEKKMEAKELRENGNFSNISIPAPPLGIESMLSERLGTYESTNLAMMKVIEALIDDKINFIGIHGIGGVGKTTMVKEIGKKAKSDKLFDEVVMAVVSQNHDIKKIQDEIAGMLGLRLTDEPSETARASSLHVRLKDEKRILVILDDVWARLDLHAVGIPFGHDHEGCKIIITTRREQVCRSMGREWEKTKIVPLEVLSEQDSWDLFRKNAGDVVDSPKLNVVAKEVFKECGHLPLALVTIGNAMKGKYDPDLWEVAAQELRRSVPTKIEGVDEKVYKCLMWSYDYLRDEETKACFLLCSLFPEDHDILIEDLVRYGIGLRVFRNVDTVKEARGRAKFAIHDLKESCLLLASDQGERYIKMHDVVRDVAISIGSTKYFVRAGCSLKNWPTVDGLNQYMGISLMRNEISNIHPDIWECPNLELLLLQYNQIAWTGLDKFFSAMKALKILDLSQYIEIPFPYIHPNAVCHLTCLQTLILEGIRIGDATFLGQIKTLEVLSLKNAFLSEAPNAIRELTNLRLLDMSASEHEFLIPANVVSPLSCLEELYLGGTIDKSGSKPGIEGTALIKSLPSLNVLTSINIMHIPDGFVFPELESFVIFIGLFHQVDDNLTPNYLALRRLAGPIIHWRKCLKKVLKRASCLSTSVLEDMKNIFPDLSADIDGLNVLKSLRIQFSSQFEYLINTQEWGTLPQAQQQPNHLQVLSNLEALELIRLDTFKGICQGELTSSWQCFLKLRRLLVDSCPELSTVILPFTLLQRLHHLENLDVRECSTLEQVFDFGLEREGLLLLSGLRELRLIYLPRLQNIFNCSNRCVHLFNLRQMYVESCSKLKCIFHSSIALPQLEILHVSDCFELEEIVAKKNEGEAETADKMVLKSLKEIKLELLPNLSGFCTENFSFEWPSLEKLRVFMCPKMKTFTATISEIQSKPKLKTINLNFIETTLQGMDLNQVLANHC